MKRPWLQRVRSLAGNEFVRSTAALTGGTAVAQILTVAALPFLTRLYSPHDFSLLAVYLSLLGMVSVIACLRLEIAIPLPEKDEDAAQLLALSRGSALLVATVVGVPSWLWRHQLATLAGAPDLAPYLWLLPLGTWLAGSYAALQYWASRKKRFTAVARTRMVQAGTGIGAQVALGAAGTAPFGLLFGHMLYGGAGALGLARQAWRQDRTAIRAVDWRHMRARFWEYRRFPQYSTFEAAANSAAIQLPVILIAALAAGPEAGFVLLASRAMGAPMQLVGSAVSQVYLSSAPEEMRAGRLRSFTLGTLGGLAKLGIAPLLVAGVIAPPVFALVFGEEWRRAGELVQWMTPWFILQFLASPVSMVLHVTGRQRTAAALQITGLLLRSGAVLLASFVLGGYEAEAYAVSGAVFYGAYLFIVLLSAGIMNTLSRQSKA
jgi:O-antigen/teichoic acid export membrane protein